MPIRTFAGLYDRGLPSQVDGACMIATVIIQEGQPIVPLPMRALDELGLQHGQYVRIHVRPLGTTPLTESDGRPPA